MHKQKHIGQKILNNNDHLGDRYLVHWYNGLERVTVDHKMRVRLPHGPPNIK